MRTPTTAIFSEPRPTQAPASTCLLRLIKNASAPIISASIRSRTKGCECRIIELGETPPTNCGSERRVLRRTGILHGERNGGKN